MRFSILSALALATAFTCAALATDPSPQPAATTASQPASQPALRITGEYGEILGMFKLQGTQRELYLAEVYKRQLALDAWDKSDDGRRLFALRKEFDSSKDPARRKELEKQISELRSRESAIKVHTRAAILSTLSPEQQKAWVAAALLRQSRRQFGGIELSEAQKDQLNALALDEASLFLKPDTLKNDPYLEAARMAAPAFAEKVKSDILTEDQRAKLAPKPSPAPPATAPATAPSKPAK